MNFAALVFILFGFIVVGMAQNGPSGKPAASIGLAVGQKAPAFSAPDQFGHSQSNQTLSGSRGTVVLFFRSADW
jgi:hypothetical protein